MNGTFMTNNQTKNKVVLPKIGSSDQYNHLMKIIQNRVTVRKFDENYIYISGSFKKCPKNPKSPYRMGPP